MASNTLKTRIINKHDTEENWNKATNFIPLKGEVIIYDPVQFPPDSSYSGSDFIRGLGYSKIKVGDGTTKVSDLPFVDDQMTEDDITSIFTEVFGS